jgi:sigma-E factor negative regulatory protein RseB
MTKMRICFALDLAQRCLLLYPKGIRALTVCTALLASANASATEAQISIDWLKIVAFAAHQAEYSGVFIYQYDNRVETSSISHVVEPDSEYEKLESLDGPKREIIRHHGQIWCYIDNMMVQVDSQLERGRFPSLLLEQLSASNANYQALNAGIERVAGYNAQVILFHPRDNQRYAHKIWVHTDSGLLLKVAVLGSKNEVIEQYAFTQLQIGAAIDRSWVGQKEPNGPGSPATPETVAIKSGWVVDALPNGFKKIKEIQRQMRGKHAPVVQIVYSDGFSGISIFIEPADGDEDDIDGLSSRGAVNLYHKVINKQLITVVGEVPARTVMQVLDSVRYKGK